MKTGFSWRLYDHFLKTYRKKCSFWFICLRIRVVSRWVFWVCWPIFYEWYSHGII